MSTKYDKIDEIIYLISTPEVSAERIKERSRKSEDEIPIEYLNELHRLHDEWLMNNKDIPVLILDADTINYNSKKVINDISATFKLYPCSNSYWPNCDSTKDEKNK